MTSSPKVMGELSHTAGRMMGPVVRGAEALGASASKLPTATQPLIYQTGKAHEELEGLSEDNLTMEQLLAQKMMQDRMRDLEEVRMRNWGFR